MRTLATASAATLLTIGVIGTGAPAPAGRLAHVEPTAVPMVPGTLHGVSSSSPTSLWAVGGTTTGKTLILRGSRGAWTRIASPSPGTTASLYAVSSSTSSAWAVGSIINVSGSSTSSQSLIVQWNGKKWVQAHSPSPGTYNFAYGVASFTSGPNRGIAVGSTGSGTTTRTFALLDVGGSWRQVNCPSPGTSSSLSGVATTGDTAVAVGSTVAGTDQYPYILRYTKGKCSSMPFTKRLHGRLAGVTMISPTNGWAVGVTISNKALIVRWNGKVWTQVSSPSPGTTNVLNGVSAGSPTSVWAVGATGSSSGTAPPTSLLVEHWNGKRWTVHPVPAEPRPAAFHGVGSATCTAIECDALAVGGIGATPRTFGVELRYRFQ